MTAAGTFFSARRKRPSKAVVLKVNPLTGEAVAACTATLEATMFTEADFMAYDTCLNMALDGDPTPEIIVTDPASGEGSALDCRFCYFGVYDICNDMFCLAQSQAARNCDPSTDDDACATECAAIEMCAADMGAAIPDCTMAQQARCFP